MSFPTTALLNIGLAQNNGKQAHLSVEFIDGVLTGLGMKPQVLLTVRSGAEPTAIVQVDLLDIKERVNRACFYLAQDCIAVHVPGLDWADELVGPGARKWGPFNAAKFIMPDANTLASHRANKTLAA